MMPPDCNIAGSFQCTVYNIWKFSVYFYYSGCSESTCQNGGTCDLVTKECNCDGAYSGRNCTRKGREEFCFAVNMIVASVLFNISSVCTSNQDCDPEQFCKKDEGDPIKSYCEGEDRNI